MVKQKADQAGVPNPLKTVFLFGSYALTESIRKNRNRS